MKSGAIAAAAPLMLGLACCAADDAAVARANPASENCVAVGGQHTAEQAPGGEIGVCLFEDNRQCEEWALLRGECPRGGIRVTGYYTTEERHCAIRGGRYRDGACSR